MGLGYPDEIACKGAASHHCFPGHATLLDALALLNRRDRFPEFKPEKQTFELTFFLTLWMNLASARDTR